MASGKATLLYGGVVAYGAAGGVGIEFAAAAAPFYAMAMLVAVPMDVENWWGSRKKDDDEKLTYGTAIKNEINRLGG